MEKAADQWSQWLLHQRFGGNEDVRQRFMAYLEPIRDRVLDSAHLNADATVLDVGCDDGLLGFAALDRVGKRGTVIFSDLSADLLDTCRSMAEATGVTERCQFVSACLPTLDGLSDRSVDAAVLRSVLIYVEDKPAAFKHLHRVLRPGGRLSLFEPINRFGYPEPPGWLWGLNIGELRPLAAKVNVMSQRYQPLDSPMLGFDERDLLHQATEAGFVDVHLTYEAKETSAHYADGLTLEEFLSVSPNPTMPTLADLLTEPLTPDEQHKLRTRMDAELQADQGHTRGAVAFLHALRR